MVAIGGINARLDAQQANQAALVQQLGTITRQLELLIAEGGGGAAIEARLVPPRSCTVADSSTVAPPAAGVAEWHV